MKQTKSITKKIIKIDVTEDIIKILDNMENSPYKALGSVQKIEGIYYINFSEGYTAYGQKQRKARDMGEVMWYLFVAIDEKKNGFDLEEVFRTFDEIGVIYYGRLIPEFIDTYESIKFNRRKKRKS